MKCLGGSLGVALVWLGGCGQLGFDALGVSPEMNGDDGSVRDAQGIEPDGHGTDMAMSPDEDGGGPFEDGGRDLGDAPRVVSVSPRVVAVEGGEVDVRISMPTGRDVVLVDGTECEVRDRSGEILRCLAPPRAPGSAVVRLRDSAQDDVILTYASPGYIRFGSSLGDRSAGVVATEDGFVYVAGTTAGTLGEANLGGDDGFVARISPAGSVEWIQQFGGEGQDTVREIALGSGGELVLSGYSTGKLFGDPREALGTDAFVAAFSPEGSFLWGTRIASAGDDEAWDVAAGSSGEVYVSLRTTGAFETHVNAGGWDYGIARLNLETGALEWTFQDGTAEDDVGHGVAAAPDGSARLVGHTRGPLLGEHFGGWDVFVADFDRDGEKRWVFQRGSVEDDLAYDVVVAADGSAFLVGETRGVLDAQPLVGGADIFAMRYDAGGAHDWTRTFGSSGVDRAFSLALRDDGAVIAGVCDPGIEDAPAFGMKDACILDVNARGVTRSVRTYGGPGDDLSSAITVDARFSGLTYWTFILDGPLPGTTEYGLDDVVIGRIRADGTLF